MNKTSSLQVLLFHDHNYGMRGDHNPPFTLAHFYHTFSASRVYTHFPSGKAGMSAFRHIRRHAENASKSVHLHWQIFCFAENAQ